LNLKSDLPVISWFSIFCFFQTGQHVYRYATARQCLVSPDPTWTLLAGQVKAALAIACDFAAAQRRAAAAARVAAADADPTVGMRLVGPGAVGLYKLNPADP
jgi:hypothetical protein